jgi:uncharacterized protein YkwD
MARRSAHTLALLAATFVAAASPAHAASSMARGTLAELNRARATHHAPRLHADRRLARAAIRHSRDMVAHRYFAHASRSGRSPAGRVERTGWMRRRLRWAVGEDLAWRAGRPTPRAIVRAWMHSPPHRRILLDPAYRVVGIGVARGTPVGSPGVTVTADFGS